MTTTPHEGLQLDLARIVALDEAVLRNLLISQRYCDLSALIAKAVDPSCANWSTFACWASKTAGESIRGEELARAIAEHAQLDGQLTSVLNRTFARLIGLPVLVGAGEVLELAQGIRAHVSAEVAEGNRKVFAELAPAFAAFAFELGPKPGDDAAWQSFAQRFTPGPVEKGGQDLLRSAFEHYHLVRSEPSAEQKAQRVLFANCLIGLHEQTRLQPNIRAAMDAPVSDLLRELVSRRLDSSPIRKLIIWPFLSHYIGVLSELLCGFARALTTRWLMRLRLPSGASLPLGQDIPARRGVAFPPALATLTMPALAELVARYDVRPESLHGSAPLDWSALPQRMGFIIDLFRTSQMDVALLGQPFSAAQRAALEQGVVPTGLL